MKDQIIKHKKVHKRKNIALIGHMGSGKSLIGKLIAKQIKFNHLDSDDLIEKKTKTKIKDIFRNKGEEKFRQIEENLILSLQNQNKVVLSLGGGSILSKKIRSFLKESFFTIFLDVDINILVNRLQNSSKRPLLLDIDIKEKILELDHIRRKYYLLSDLTIYNQDTPEKIIKVFLQEYKTPSNYEKNNQSKN